MNGINGISARNIPVPGTLDGNSVDKGFARRLSDAVSSVNIQSHEANAAVEKAISGEGGIQEGMIALQEAGISMRVLIQFRNKAVEAYKEIIRMPV